MDEENACGESAFTAGVDTIRAPSWGWSGQVLQQKALLPFVEKSKSGKVKGCKQIQHEKILLVNSFE